MATLPSTTTDLSADSAAAPAISKRVFVIEKSFDLTTLLAAVIANADVINLFSVPANYAVVAAGLKATAAGTKDATSFTLQLRYGTTAITAALDATTAGGVAIGGAATYSLPAGVGSSAAHINLVAAIAGGNAVATKNPVVRVTLVCVDLS